MNCVVLLVVGTLVLGSLSVGSSASPTAGVIYAAAPEERGAFHVGGKGVYNYGYNTGDGIAKVEVRHLDGSVTGSYRYFDPNGRQIVRSYIADNKGFRVLGNELPIAPDTPALGIIDAQTLTGPVEGTQEFSSPNFVTSGDSALLLQNQVGRQSIITSVQKVSGLGGDAHTQYQQKLVQQQNDFAQQQQELIRQQQEKLEQLKVQHKEFLRQQQEQIEQLKILQRQQQQQQAKPQTHQYFQQSPSGYVSSINQATNLDSPYFYAQDNINYDFPAGFAYNVGPSYPLNPVGVKGERASLLVTAGLTNNIRYHNQRYDKPWRSSYESKSHRHPYILGHAR